MKKKETKKQQPPSVDLVGSLIVPGQDEMALISPSAAEKLILQMDYALNIATNSPDLSPEERKLFEDNCLIIRQTRVALVVRNHKLLEVFEARQWREKYKSVIEFAKQVADLSKSQLYKCLDEARLVDVFAREKLTNSMPKGRYVELLVRLPKEHWIAAWTRVQDECADHELSVIKARDILRDFCRDRKIPFNRRKPNGENADPAYSSFLLPAPKADAKKKAEDGEWIHSLSEDQEKQICGIVSEALRKAIDAAFKTKKSSEIILETLSESGMKNEFSAEEFKGLSVVLGLLKEHDPESYKRLALQALHGLKENLGKKLRQRCDKNQKGRADYARKKKGKGGQTPQ